MKANCTRTSLAELLPLRMVRKERQRYCQYRAGKGSQTTSAYITHAFVHFAHFFDHFIAFIMKSSTNDSTVRTFVLYSSKNMLIRLQNGFQLPASTYPKKSNGQRPKLLPKNRKKLLLLPPKSPLSPKLSPAKKDHENPSRALSAARTLKHPN